MTGKSDTGGAEEAKVTEAQEGAATAGDEAGKAPRPRRIVRSRSTAVAGEGDAPKAEGEATEAASSAVEGGAVEGGAPEEKSAAPAPKPRHDMRAPAGTRPRPEGMPQRPPRPGALPSRPRPEGMPQRPPRPGPLPERSFDADRPRPPRGDGPGQGPGGPRREGGPRGDRGPRREGGPRGDRPRFEGRTGAPGEAGAARTEARPVAGAEAGGKPAGDRGARPAQKPAAPAQKPVVPAAAPKAAPKPTAPVSLTSAPKGNKPVFVPLLRAGQTPAAAKQVALTPKEALAAKTKAHAPKPQGKHEEKPEAAASSAKQDFSSEALQAGWDTAKSFADQAGEAASALVDAWLAGSNVTAIAAIADANDVASAARKAARRALAVLKSRGVAIPERPRSAKVEERAEAFEATMIPCDSYGTWSVAITSRDASGRYRIAEVIGRDPAGVIQAAGGWLSGSQLKEGRARAQSNVGMAPVPVPLAWARARVVAALAKNAASGQVVPFGYESCRELFEVASEGTPAHPIADLEGKEIERVEERVKGSATLHEEPEFGGWLPERRALDEMMQAVGTRLGPTGTQDPAAVSVAITEEADAATDRYFTPDMRDLLASRMRDSAISVRSRRGDERALDVLATARAVKEAGLITSPPREIPFLVAFFQKGLSALAQMGGGRLRVPRGPAPAATPAPAPAEPAAEGAPAPAEST